LSEILLTSPFMLRSKSTSHSNQIPIQITLG
jgi:hypothetical protein